MDRTSMRSTRLVYCRRLVLAGGLAALSLAACSSHPLTQPNPQPAMVTDLYISVAPSRQLDLVFMIDNSPSMAPKQQKLRDNFPRFITALEAYSDGILPDLRVAIIDSDLGTGGAYDSGSCGPKLLPDGSSSSYGDLGRFQMIGASECGISNPDARWIEYGGGKPMNYNGDIEHVFACLAGNLGTMGCGEEHQLQAFEFALAAKGVGNEEQQKFLRPNAYLGLVFLSDEDDCSAATNDGMFGEKSDLRNESASLRCATRAHVCGGRNLASTGPGYPTTASFSAPFSTCAARTDDCPNPTDGAGNTDTSQPTTCSPLKGVKRIADEIKALKSNPDEQILVAGIFGWPRAEDDPAAARYTIDKIPNPNIADTLHPQVYDYWPVCYDPNHQPKDANNFDPDAAGWGAAGALRMSAFVDEFGKNGLKFSICETDFSDSMRRIGEELIHRIGKLCVDEKLLDTEPSTPGIQADCRVVLRTPRPDPRDPNKIVYEEDPNSMPQCDAVESDDSQPAYPCWKLVSSDKCQVNGQLINVVRAPAERGTPLTTGTKVGMQCETCTAPIPGVQPVPGCDY